MNNNTNFFYREFFISLQMQQAIRSANRDELKEICKNLREEIIKVCSLNGGHLSSNLGVVEIVVGLIKEYDYLNDDIIFDVGHQSYVFKLLSGRDISTIRQENGIHPFQTGEESLFDKISAGHAGTSLSLGYAFSKFKQLNNIDSKTIVIIGDASLANGMSLEAINLLAEDNKINNLTIIVNDNGMSISKARGGVAKSWSKFRNSRFYINNSFFFRKVFNSNPITRPFYLVSKHLKDRFKRLVIADNFIEALGFDYIGPIDGHDINQIRISLKRADKNKKVTFIHFLTTKGKGFNKAEADELGFYHGVNPFNLENGESNISNNESTSFSKIVGNLIYDYMKKDTNSYCFNPAMVNGSSLIKTFDAFPERCFDVGICEEHCVTFASGFALKGGHCFVSLYSTFMQRSYDQISHDVARMNLPVVFLVERSGLVGADGETHQGIYDVAFINSIPNCKVYQPYDYLSMNSCFDSKVFGKKSPIFIRITRDNIPNNLIKDGEFEEQKLSQKKSETLVIATGYRGNKLLEKLSNVDKLILFNLIPTKDELISICPHIAKYKKIIFIDKYSIFEGSASVLLKDLNDLNYQGKYIYFCIDKSFIRQGSIDEQLAFLSMDDNTLIEKINKEIIK